MLKRVGPKADLRARIDTVTFRGEGSSRTAEVRMRIAGSRVDGEFTYKVPVKPAGSDVARAEREAWLTLLEDLKHVLENAPHNPS